MSDRLSRKEAEEFYIDFASDEILQVLPESPSLAWRALWAARRKRFAFVGPATRVLRYSAAGLALALVAKVTIFPGAAEAHLASMIHWWMREAAPVATQDEEMSRVIVMPNGEVYAATLARRTGEPYALVRVVEYKRLNTSSVEEAVKAASRPLNFNPFRR